MSAPDRDAEWQRQRELLAGKVIGDLTEVELTEVASLLQQPSCSDELFELEKCAAALELAASSHDRDGLPDSLRMRLQSDAETYFQSAQTASVVRQSAEFPKPASTGTSRREWLAWACCAAALLLCLGLIVPRSEAPLNASLARAELLESSSDVIRVEWASGTTPFENPVSGDVVWSNDKQVGYMLFNGMPMNDPTVEQYQLWIIDPGRDDEPIDGGVFDVNDSGQVVVEIKAKLAVVSPQAFAITVEKPGGVVVSTQERLPLLAPVP